MKSLEIFIHRPVATTLLMIAIALAGAAAFRLLPVSPLPQVDFPTISVSAQLPGASAETMASSVATPLERQFGRIAGVSEMTSSSTLGSTGIILQFDLSRNINAAARDVLAAINAARGYLPANLPNNPTYRKVNPSDSPIMILSLTSTTLSKGQIYDAASTILAQRLAQIPGVGQVSVGGSSLPGVRVELNPDALNNYGVGLDQVRTALSNTNANLPKGQIADGTAMWQIGANDQLHKAVDYAPLIVAYHNGSAVRVGDVGQTLDSVEDVRSAGYANGQPAILVIIFRQPGANIIATVDSVRAVLPQVKASISSAIDINVAMDQTTTIRASVHDVERTLLISIGLVIAVVFLFLRSVRTAIIPSVAVPLSLVGTFGVMYLLGYSLDNLSLMALAILISMATSLSGTPMMCAHLLKNEQKHGHLYWLSERAFQWILGLYGRTLNVALRFSGVTFAVLLCTIGLTAYLAVRAPKGFFPQQDTGRIIGTIRADQDTSFQAMDRTLRPMIKIVNADP